jgi:adhesin transport system outer membrane protein
MGVGIALLFTAHPSGATTLEDAVRLAISTNPQVLGAAASVRAAGFDLRQAKGGYYPRVDFDAGYGREHTNIKQLSQAGNDKDDLSPREAGLTVRQLLWDGFATKRDVERRVALLNSAEFSLSDTQEAIAFRATEAFIDVIRNRELVSLARENVVSHEKTLDNVQARYDSGVGNLGDVDQAKARFALAQSVLTAREGRLREAIARYERVIGETPDELATPGREQSGLVSQGTVDRPELSNAIDAAQNDAFTSHPAILQSEAEVTAAEASVKAAKAAYHPKVDLEGSLRRDDNIAGVEGNRNSDAIMVVTRWNLFRGGADKAQEQAAIERKSEALEAADDTRRAVAENVAIAYQAKTTSESRIAYLESYVKSTTGTLQSYRAQFELNRRTLLDVLNAENELFNARSNLASSEYDDLVNQYFIDASKGQLTQRLGVGSSTP